MVSSLMDRFHPFLLRILLQIFLLGGLSHGWLRAQDPAPMSKAAGEMTDELQKLKEEGKLTNSRDLSSAVRRVVRDNSIQHDIPAPLGAKVVAVHKHPGDLVHIGDKIVTLLVNGKEVPILAKQDGIMQTINVSKGGFIGNSRPLSARHSHDTGIIRLTTLRSIST